MNLDLEFPIVAIDVAQCVVKESLTWHACAVHGMVWTVLLKETSYAESLIVIIIVIVVWQHLKMIRHWRRDRIKGGTKQSLQGVAQCMVCIACIACTMQNLSN